jgi:hypothetical protein
LQIGDKLRLLEHLLVGEIVQIYGIGKELDKLFLQSGKLATALWSETCLKLELKTSEAAVVQVVGGIRGFGICVCHVDGIVSREARE